MKNDNWTILSSKTIAQKGWFSLQIDSCQLPDGRIFPEYIVVNVPNWSNIIIATTNDELVMVQQYRHAAGVTTIEPAGGLIDKDETPLQAAIREMQEETGYSSSEIIFLQEAYANPALQPTKAYFYLAKNAVKTHNLKFDEFEDINTIILPKQKVLQMLQNNEFTNGVQVGAIYKAVLNLGWI